MIPPSMSTPLFTFPFTCACRTSRNVPPRPRPLRHGLFTNKAAQYVATALAPLVLGGHLELGPLLASPCEGLIEGGKAAEFAVVAIKQVRSGCFFFVLLRRQLCEGEN